jgi:acyl-CoA thioester hydrolase
VDDRLLLGTEIWRGGVNTWDCDEMGHMNVRFYVTRATEGLAALAAQMGMPFAFAPHANATLLIREQHIRFLREAHAGASLHMVGGIISMSQTEAWLLQVIYHTDSGEPAATFQTRVAHVTARDAVAFDWPEATLKRAQALMVEVPAFAATRSLSLTEVKSQASLAKAEELDMMPIALGAIMPQDCDVFGRMRPEQFIGRVSDGIGRLVMPLRQIVSDNAAIPLGPIGGAVLEYRLIYLDWPMAGDRVAVRSGLQGADARTMRVMHWILDPETGKAWGTSEAVVITFDLEARKVVPITDEAKALLLERASPNLTL